MTDEHEQAVDQRARAAAEDLRAVAGRRAVPTFEPVPLMTPPLAPDRGRSHRRLVAAAAVLLALTVAATVAITRTDDDADPTGPVETGQLRGWAVDDLPEGLTMAGAGQDRFDPTSVRGTSMGVYGPEDGHPMVGVAGMRGWSIGELPTDDGVERFQSDGTPALDVSSYGLASTAVVIDDAKAANDGIVAVGPDLDRNELVRLAKATRVTDGTARIAPTDLPDGWKLLFEEPAGLFAGTTTALARDGLSDARSVTYLDADVTEAGIRSLTISGRMGDERLLDVLWLRSEQVEVVDIGGRRALLARRELLGGIGTAWTVAWADRTGELVSVDGWNLSRDEVLDAARAARPLTEDEWDDLERQSQLDVLGDGDGGGGGRAVVAEGTLGDGTAFALRAGADRGPDLRVAVDDQGEGSGDASSSSFGGAPADLVRGGAWTEVAGRRFQAALVDPQVATVVLRVDGREIARVDTGDITSDEAVREELGESLADSRWFVIEVTDGANALALLDADGTELASHILRDTGIDPDGFTPSQDDPPTSPTTAPLGE